MPGSMKRGSVTEEQHRDEESWPLQVSGSSHGVRSADRKRRAKSRDEARAARTQVKAENPGPKQGRRQNAAFSTCRLVTRSTPNHTREPETNPPT